MEKLLALSSEQLRRLAEDARQLEKRISFSKYLQHQQFTRLENGFFVKISPPQLIQLIDKHGECYYVNHVMNGDSGRLMEFIMHRLEPNGKIVPLYGIKVSELLVAVEIARLFLRDVSRLKIQNRAKMASTKNRKGGKRP